MRHCLLALAAGAFLCGCSSKPGVSIDADIGSSKPIALQVAASQPVQLNGQVSLDKPITVNIEGLVVPYEGTFIPEPLIGQINENDSTEYVAAILGKPDFETQLGDGTLVWRWKYRPTAQQGSLFSVFGGSGKSDEPRPDHVTTIAIFKDNKLTKKWRG